MILKLLLLGILLVVLGLVIYQFTNVSHATKTLEEYQNTYQNIQIEETENNIIKMSSNKDNNDTAIFFYPGASVEYRAYIPLLEKLVSDKVDVYIFAMKRNLAFFSPDRADEILSLNRYKNNYIAGHSLGGRVGAEYGKHRKDKLNGVILLSSLSKEDLSDSDISMIEIYGENDEITKAEISGFLKHNSKDTQIYVIDGANHAQFGDYGKQLMDKEALISADEQRSIAIKEINSFIVKHNKLKAAVI